MMYDDFAYYNENHDSITNGHMGEFVVIMDKSVIGYFQTEEKALEAMKDNALGTFLVKKCAEKEDEIMKYYTRRVAFA